MPFCGKHSHRSIGAAEAHLRSLKAKRKAYDGDVYACDKCHGWHVGRERAAAHRDKYARRRA